MCRDILCLGDWHANSESLRYQKCVVKNLTSLLNYIAHLNKGMFRI